MSDIHITDPGSLQSYLADRGYQMLASEVLTGGVSNHTVLVRLRDGFSIVVKEAKERLTSNTDWFSDPRRIRQEALAMEWLCRWAPDGSIPRLLFLDTENNILAMRAIAQPHNDWKTLLLSRQICEIHFSYFGQLLASIHSGGYRDRALIEPLFRDQSYFFSLRVEAYYLYGARNVPAGSQFLLDLVEKMHSRRFTFVHGDYSPKNILVTPDHFVLLDHEAAHFGEATFDVGFGLAHLLSKAHHLPDARTSLHAGAREFWRAYQSGIPQVPEFADVQDRAVRHTLGCLMARVAGKSLLEYLTPQQRETQSAIVLSLMAKPPESVENLIDIFIGRVDEAL